MRRLIAKSLAVCLLTFGFTAWSPQPAHADDPLTPTVITALLWTVSEAVYPSVLPNDNCAVCDQLLPQIIDEVLYNDMDIVDAVTGWLDFVGGQVAPSYMASTCGSPNLGFTMEDSIGTWTCGVVDLGGRRMFSWILEI